MSKRTFRFLVLIYVLLILAGIASVLIERRIIPIDIIESANNNSFVLMKETTDTVKVSIWIVLIIVVMAEITGVIGLLFLIGWSRYVFVSGVILTIFCNLLSKWDVSTAFASVFGEFEILTSGVIISFVFWGPAKLLFEKKKDKLAL